MEIKTITCHNVYNYGASLQAYALQYFLESQGHSVEIINFQPYFHQTRYNFKYIPRNNKYYKYKSFFIFFIYIYNIIKKRKMLITWGRKIKFDRFTDKYLNLTRCKYETSLELKKNPPLADIYIAGSDQIWNTEMDNGKEPAYYLDFGSKNTKRISYAASFAIENVENKLKPFIKEKLSNLDKISVREISGLNILKSLNINGEVVIDPVFLLCKKEWIDLSQAAFQYPHLERNKYILVYDFLSDSRIKDIALKIKNINNCKIVSVNDFREVKYADININNAGPLEFIQLILNSTLVISSSFHATAFSIILEKNFYVYSLKGFNNSSRMIDLLNTLELTERYNSSEILKEINYDFVRPKLSQMIDKSKTFLIRNTSNKYN